MKIKSIIFVFIGMMLLLPLSCTRATNTPVPTIDSDKAVMIAATYVPYSVIRASKVALLQAGNDWVVYFLLRSDAYITKNELAWPDSPAVKYVNQGTLPADKFSLLAFKINGETGEIYSWVASDAVLLGGPGTFYTEPPPVNSPPLWFTIAAPIAGVLVGGILVWLIMRRKTRQG